MKKKQATAEFSGKAMKRWYGIYVRGDISVTWAETEEIATEKFKTSEENFGELKSVLPAPSAVEEVRPLKKNMHRNAAE